MCEERLRRQAQMYLSLRDRNVATPEQLAAWEEFYPMSVAIIFAVVRQVRAARPVSEDIAQDVFAKLVAKLPNFHLDPARGDLESWVKAIALHEAWRWVRKRVKRREGPLDPEAVDELFDPQPGPDRELERMQEHELFKGASPSSPRDCTSATDRSS